MSCVYERGSPFSRTEYNYVIWRKVDATGDNHTKQTKSVSEGQAPLSLSHMFFLDFI